MTAQLALTVNVILFSILAVSTVYLAGRTSHVKYATVTGVCACLALVLMGFVGELL